MKKWDLMIAVLMVVMLAVSSVHFQAQPGNGFPQAINGAPGKAQVTIDKGYGQMPLTFIPNKGQMDKQVYFYLQGKDKSVYFTSTGLTYSLVGKSSRWVVKLDFVGARKDVKPESLEKSGTVVSYFKGQKKDWQTGLETASKIIYRELWPGIDLVYYGTVNKLKYEFIVHPGADPAAIKLAYRGADSVKENSQGQLEVQTPTGSFFDDTPVAYQEIAGKCEPVALKYALENKHPSNRQDAYTYGFSVGAYDKSLPLVLDPVVIIYCGYIGGGGWDEGTGIKVDASNCAYITGNTPSAETSFPVKVGPDVTYNGSGDAFVVKVNAGGTGLVYCGYIGGNASEMVYEIAVDASGCAYITGNSYSTEASFPVTAGPDITYNGNCDAFVAKVNASGTGLVYCGYIGGSSSDSGRGIVVDGSGCAYITGTAASTEATFPVAVGPTLTHNGNGDSFVAKVKADGTGLTYCGYIGGYAIDIGLDIALDGSGCAYIIGYTGSSEAMSFPLAVGPDLTFNGGDSGYGIYDSFVAKVKANGTALDYCGYIGGSGTDWGHGIAVDGSGCAYVSGFTNSTEATFPVTVGPDLTQNGERDVYVAKVRSDGTALAYCGFIGGSHGDFAYDIAVDTSGCTYITGSTASTETSFPVNGGPDLTLNGSEDAFVVKVNESGTAFHYCGYIGGSAYDLGSGIAVDESGCVYITGYTQTTGASFPVTIGPDLTYNGGTDAFVAKITDNPIYTVTFAAGSGGSLTGTTNQTVMQGGTCTAVEAVPDDDYQFVNWTGTNGFITTTDNPLTVTNVNSNMLITANFVYSNLTGWIPSEDLQNNMIVYGKAFNVDNPAGAGDWLGAFGPGGISDCRGIAAVQANGSYYITIGSNEISGETITFKLWPLPSGPDIDSNESIPFIENGVYKDLPLHFGLRTQNFALVNGWNWISFNTLPDDTSFNAVFGTTGVIEQVKSQTQAAIYSDGNWIGDLTGMSGITDGIMYKIKTNQAYAFNVTGTTIPYNTPLSLIGGWNWTAYLPTLSQPVADAVNSIITPVDQVKSQTQSVIKIGSTLFGDLTQMEPNKGYLISMNQAGILQYPQGELTFPGLAAGKTAATKAQVVSWPVMKGNQYNMVVLGKVYFAGKVVNTDGYYLASIGPNGEKDGRSIGPVKTDGSYFATILGNTGGETVKFKLLDSTNNKTYDVAGSLVFRPDDLKTGLDLKARSVKVTAPAGGADMRMGTDCTIAWEAYEVNNVKIELYKGGRSFSVIASSVTAGTQAYSWAIPDRMPAGDDYQIKVSASDAGVIAKDLSRAFSIKPAPFIALLSPNGGEVWKVKQVYDITWRSGGIDNVKIELYKGTELKTVISGSTPAATGKYTWTIPANHPQGTNYKIRITSVDAGLNLGDTGDSPFSIK